MNIFVSIANLCKDPETLELGGKECMKLRLADNTFGKTETRYFDAIVSGFDVDTAKRLETGDQIVVVGTLQKTSYKAKKGKLKGKTVEQDQMPFAKILQVTRSEKFFSESEEGEPGEVSDEEPELDAEADEGGDDAPDFA